jgi:hypothetical protein
MIILLKKRVAAAAAAAHIQIAWQPFRAPELMPCEDLWRLAEQALHSIGGLSPLDHIRRLACSVQSFGGYLLGTEPPH